MLALVVPLSKPSGSVFLPQKPFASLICVSSFTQQDLSIFYSLCCFKISEAVFGPGSAGLLTLATRRAGTGGTHIQGLPRLHSELKTSLGNLPRPYFREKSKKKDSKYSLVVWHVPSRCKAPNASPRTEKKNFLWWPRGLTGVCKWKWVLPLPTLS